MTGSVRIVVCVLVSILLPGCASTQQVSVWGPPPTPTSDPGPYVDQLAAFRAGNCSPVLVTADEQGREARLAIESLFHPPETAGHDTAGIRGFLTAHTSADAAVLLVGEHGFEYPAWWSDVVAYCLGDAGRFDEAAQLYRRGLLQSHDPNRFMRLAVVTYRGGDPAAAVAILQAWPGDVDVPVGHREVLETMRAGHELGNSVQAASGSLD